MTTPSPHRKTPEPQIRRRYRGCLLGGAVGDALGAPVEFMTLDQIRAQFGPAGITNYTTAFDRRGAITDDTQLTLFTAEGLLRSHLRSALRGDAPLVELVAMAYLRWLRTQGTRSTLLEPPDGDGWLIGNRELHAKRVPSNACLMALDSMTRLGARATNRSKGCSGVMRAAPVGLFCARAPGASVERAARRAFDLGIECAALTDGHPTGQVAAGAVAALVSLLVRDVPLPLAIAHAKALVSKRPLHDETLRAIEAARQLASEPIGGPAAIARLGEGWVAEEALAIALYATLTAPDFTTGALLAVNHDGDSDTTGAIAGNLLGALHGIDSIPRNWLHGLELGDVVAEVADDLATYPDWPVGEFLEHTEEAEYWNERYPPR